MAVRKSLATVLLVFAFGGCAELIAERPLFSVADQGLPPLQGGVWISLGEGCAEYNVRRRRFPSECMPLDIRQQEDGAWRVAVRVDLISGLDARERAEAEEDAQNGPYRVLLVPAVERTVRDEFAPMYVGELSSVRTEGAGVSYAIVVPIGSMPATEAYIALMIGCDSILRDGPIEGITPRYATRIDERGQERQTLADCVASNQTAVRAAVRRAVIEDFDSLTERRFVYVRAD